MGPGDEVLVTMTCGEKAKKRTWQKQARVLAEYEHFWLLTTGRYRFCVNKAGLKCGDAKVEVVRSARAA